MKFQLLLESKQDDLNFRNWLYQEYKDTDIHPDTLDLEVDYIIDKFNRYKDVNKFSDPDMKSYYYWINKRSLDELKQEFSKIQNTLSKSEQRKKAKEGTKLIFNQDGYKGYAITTYDAMKYYGSGTEWCAAGSGKWGKEKGPEYFDSEFIGDAYYVLITPRDCTWQVEDNGEVNVYSGKVKYCVQYDSYYNTLNLINATDKYMLNQEKINFLALEQQIENVCWQYEVTEDWEAIYSFISVIIDNPLAKAIQGDTINWTDNLNDLSDYYGDLNKALLNICEDKLYNLNIITDERSLPDGIFFHCAFNNITIDKRSWCKNILGEAMWDVTCNDFICNNKDLDCIYQSAFLDAHINTFQVTNTDELHLFSDAFCNCSIEKFIAPTAHLILEESNPFVDCPNLQLLECYSLHYWDQDEDAWKFLKQVPVLKIHNKQYAQELIDQGFTNIQIS